MKQARLAVHGLTLPLKAIALLAASSFISIHATAQTLYWHGKTNDDWSTSASDTNWANNPNFNQNNRFVTGRDVVFSQAAIALGNNTVSVSTLTAGNIQVTNSSGTFAFSGLFQTLTATSLTVNGGGNLNLGSLDVSVGSGSVNVSNGSELRVGAWFLVDFGGLTAGTINASGSFTQGSNGNQGNTNASGTIVLGANNRINNSAAITLGGGTLRTDGFDEGTSTTAGLGTLTLTANSILDFTNTDGLLHFSGFSPGSFTLQVWNWDNSDRLYFSPQLDAAQLAQIVFYSDNGLTQLGNGSIGTGGGIVPIPEPGTIFGAVAVLGFVSWRERRRIGAILQPLG